MRRQSRRNPTWAGRCPPPQPQFPRKTRSGSAPAPQGLQRAGRRAPTEPGLREALSARPVRGRRGPLSAPGPGSRGAAPRLPEGGRPRAPRCPGPDPTAAAGRGAPAMTAATRRGPRTRTYHPAGPGPRRRRRRSPGPTWTQASEPAGQSRPLPPRARLRRGSDSAMGSPRAAGGLAHAPEESAELHCARAVSPPLEFAKSEQHCDVGDPFAPSQ